MSTSEKDAPKADQQGSTTTINSPERPQAKASSQASRYGLARTETPSNPPNPSKAYANPIDESAVGNPNALASLKIEGQLGFFYPRDLTHRLPTAIEVDFGAIRGAAARVLKFVLTELTEKQRELDFASNERQVNEIVLHLSNGICVMTYLKLHSVNYNDEALKNRYRIRPEVPDPFEIPAPFALAITQLGAIKLSSMSEELYLTPTAPADSDQNFGCETGFTWSPVVYSKFVVQAKKIGLQFSTVDRQVKLGSSWWLYRPESENANFQLECPYPEENFTPNTAVLASLFCNTEAGGFNNAIIDTTKLGDGFFCSFLRNPIPNLSVHSYYAIAEEKEVGYLFSG